MTHRLLLTVGLVLFLSASASAQLVTQTALVGTIADGGGGVVPGAQVVAVNTGTKDTYETTTNAEGYYQIQFVRTGTYSDSLRAERDPAAADESRPAGGRALHVVAHP